MVNVSLATKRIWREESRKRRMEKAGTYSFDWISTKTLLRFVALVGTARKHGLRHEPWDRPPLFFLSFFSLPLPLLFSKRNRYLVSVYLHCWHDESAEITRISFPSSGREKRLPASLVISCRLAIAGFRSLSPGSLGVISGKLFRGSSWSTFG